MNTMLSIGLSIIKNLCFNSIFIIRDVNVRFLIVLLIREPLVNDMWRHSETVGGVKSAGGVLFPIQTPELSGCTSRVDFQSSLA